MTKSILVSLSILTAFLICSCSEENCDDIACHPCPPYSSYYTILRFQSEGDLSFNNSDLDSNYSIFYQTDMNDTILLSEISYDLFSIDANATQTPNFFGDIEFDSIKLVTEQNEEFVFSQFQFNNITPNPAGCCTCPVFDLTQVNINNQSYSKEELPILITK